MTPTITNTPRPTFTPTVTPTPTIFPASRQVAILDMELTGQRFCRDTFEVTAYGTDGTSLGVSLGTYTCGPNGIGYTRDQSVRPGRPLLLEFRGEIPLLACGDFVRVVPINGPAFEVYLPSNYNGEYGDYLALYVQQDGSTLYAADASDRNASPNQTPDEAYLAGDYAARPVVQGGDYTMTGQTASNFDYLTLGVCRGNLETARDLWNLIASQGGRPLSIGRWNVDNQGYQVFFQAGPNLFGDFAIAPGDVLVIEFGGTSSFEIRGALPLPGEVFYELRSADFLATNYNFVGLPQTAATLSASDLLSDIETEAGVTVNEVAVWNAVAQSWTMYIPAIHSPGSTNDFSISSGEAVRLELDGIGVWIP